MDTPVHCRIICIFLFTFVCTIKAETRIQMFSIHREENCGDSGEFFTKSERNLARVSPLVTCGVMSCFCNHYGLWIFSSYKNYKPSRRHPIKSGYSFFEQRGETCESRKLNWQFQQLHSIRHIGNSDTSVRTLSLYHTDSFLGPELRLTGSSLSLPIPMEFNSVGFTGGRTWAIYPSVNFKGNYTCVGPPKPSSLIYNHPNISLTVGSIYSKCPKVANFTLPRPVNYLILYKTAQNGDGSSEDNSLFFDGKEVQLPTQQIFVEFSIRGSEKWTIYAGSEFNGKSRCLATFGEMKSSGNEKLRRFRFRRSKNVRGNTTSGKIEIESPDFGETWLIGSIRFGCSELSSDLHEEDYEDQLYDYFEGVQPMEAGDDNLFEWNTTNQNVYSSPATPNRASHLSMKEIQLIGIKVPIGVILSLCFLTNDCGSVFSI